MFKRTFKTRIESAMSLFVKTRDSLTEINNEMSIEAEYNQDKIDELETKNRNMTGMLENNNRVIDNINAIIG